MIILSTNLLMADVGQVGGWGRRQLRMLRYKGPEWGGWGDVVATVALYVGTRSLRLDLVQF